ncbi:accessory factor UbiK family protein [Oceanobacter kriegii]|uniref:accessory factor UbiK family protein n=1 Tax=Oceanobacter kriegii TaxID=64972 RepID=UPI0004113C03|nr:accessory factor UbiK family protein [Oceanobacter kriegii]
MNSAEIRMKIEELLAKAPGAQLPSGMHKNLAQHLTSWLGDSEWVTRDEYDRLQHTLAATELKLQALEQRLEAIERS